MPKEATEGGRRSGECSSALDGVVVREESGEWVARVGGEPVADGGAELAHDGPEAGELGAGLDELRSIMRGEEVRQRIRSAQQHKISIGLRFLKV